MVLMLSLKVISTNAQIKDSTVISYNQFRDYVEYLKVNPPQPKDKELSSFITSWMGVRYRLGGSTKRGIDCSQFSKRLYREVYGIRLGENCAQQWKQTKRIGKEDLQVSDIIFFRSSLSPSGWHCGVYIGDNRFVHASNKKEGVKISSLFEPRYMKAYKGAGRVN